uniref:MORC4 protein n=1 Tax=Dromaius novaehollandiae TaxID=8790 RepID=A0A8C4J694_DRONO
MDRPARGARDGREGAVEGGGGPGGRGGPQGTSARDGEGRRKGASGGGRCGARPCCTAPDNASDPSVTAKLFCIDVVELKGHLCLTFTDNGAGMTPHKLHRMLSFGFTEKALKRNHRGIGVYGNGFKSGSMRLGKDAIVFTKNGGALSVGLLSQTYLERVHAEAATVPLVPFNQQNKKIIVTEDSVPSLEAILEHTLFNTTEELLAQFDAIPGKKGTRILIWNIRRYGEEGRPDGSRVSCPGDRVLFTGEFTEG